MKKVYFVVILSLLFASSCTTITKRNRVYIEVDSMVDSVTVVVNDKVRTTYLAPTTIEVKPSKEPLILRLSKNGVTKDLHLDSQLSQGFYLGNLFWGPIGYIVDMTNSKKYTYPDYVLLDSDLSVKVLGHDHSDYYLMRKNQIVCRIAIPEGNYFYMNKGGNYGNALGFFGMTVGLDYYATKKLRLNVDMGALMNCTLPFPTPLDFTKDRSSSAAFIDLQVGSYLRKFHFDGGLQYTRTFFTDNSPESSYNLTIQNNVGLALSAHYRFLPEFSLGVNYYPSFMGWQKSGSAEFQYSHLLFLEVLFTFDAYKPKKAF